jgi:hypothetical protein
MCLAFTLQSFAQVHLVLRCSRKYSSTLTHTVELRHLRDDTFFVVREAPFSDIAVGCIYQLLKGPVALTRFRAALASDALVELRAGADPSVLRTGLVSALHCSGEDAGCVVDVLDCLPGAQRGVPFGGATVQALFSIAYSLKTPRRRHTLRVLAGPSSSSMFRRLSMAESKHSKGDGIFSAVLPTSRARRVSTCFHSLRVTHRRVAGMQGSTRCHCWSSRS